MSASPTGGGVVDAFPGGGAAGPSTPVVAQQLHAAARAGNAERARSLLYGRTAAPVDAPDNAGRTPLQVAAAEGHEDTVRVLLAHGARVDRRDAVHNNTALHEAAWRGFSRTVRLLATGAGAAAASTTPSTPGVLDICNAGGATALHLACQRGHNQSCRELLVAGAAADARNGYGDAPLHTAARYGHAGAARILVSARCNPAARNRNGDTPLHVAAAMGRRKLTRLIANAPGADLQARNRQKETARDIAVRKGFKEIVEILDSPVTREEEEKRKQKKKHNKKSPKPEQGQAQFEPTTKWSPYGCHYFPDPKAFPEPKLDTLPNEPLKHGEQYYLDLAGNIRKGPVGVGYTCYCVPLFQNIEARMDRDKKEIKAHLERKVAGLEQRTKGRLAALAKHVARSRSAEFILDDVESERPSHRRSISPEQNYFAEKRKSKGHVSLKDRSSKRSIKNRNSQERQDMNQVIKSHSADILKDLSTPESNSRISPEKLTFKSEVLRQTANPQSIYRNQDQNKYTGTTPKKSVTEIVALIQKQNEERSRNWRATGISVYNNSIINNKSELHVPIDLDLNKSLDEQSDSSDDEDKMHEMNVDCGAIPDYENVNKRVSAWNHYCEASEEAMKNTSVNDSNQRLSALLNDSKTISDKVDQSSNVRTHSGYLNMCRTNFDKNNQIEQNGNRSNVNIHPENSASLLNNVRSINNLTESSEDGFINYYGGRVRSGLYCREESPKNEPPITLCNYEDNMGEKEPYIDVNHSEVFNVSATYNDVPNSTGLYVLGEPTFTQSNSRLHIDTNGGPNPMERRRKPVDFQLLEQGVRDRISGLQLADRMKKKDVMFVEHNDSGYSTKVYGSSQGNSPSLSGQMDPATQGDIGVSSLV